MPKKQTQPKKATKESDSAYFFKIALFLMFGALWVHVELSTFVLPVPLGFIIGMVYASHDHFKIDRKIEYAVLLIAMLLAFFIGPRLVLAV